MATVWFSDPLADLIGYRGGATDARSISAVLREVETVAPQLQPLALTIEGALPPALTFDLDGVQIPHSVDAELVPPSELTIRLVDPRLADARELFEFHVVAADRAGDGVTLRRWGRAYERIGEVRPALDAYRRGSDHGDAIASRHRGQLCERLGELPEARDAYETAIERGDIVALRLLAVRANADGDREHAEMLFRRAAAEGDAQSARTLAAMYRERGNDGEAIRLLSHAATSNAPAARDLAELYRDQGLLDIALETLAQHADRPSLQLRAAIENAAGDVKAATGDVAAGAEADPFSLAARLTPDVPSERDLLGMAPFVSGLAHLVQDPGTELPLAIAVTGRWGDGKSSVMLQLQHKLRAWNEPAEAGTSSRRWKTVSFAAWKYDRRERLWAALANSVYSQPQATMRWHERLKFRTRLEWRRRGWLDFLRSFLWPLPLSVPAAVALIATGLGLAGVAAAAAGVLAIATLGARATGLITDPFKRAIEKHSHTPDYQQQLGFTEAAENDIGCLLDVLAPTERDAVAVFVDDLDRCSSEHVVEVVETMNQIFNARREHRCLFVLGMDREVVAAAIESQYADVVARLHERKSPLGDSFGTHFLAKLVQLTVAVPEPSLSAVRNLLRAIAAPQVTPLSSPDGQPGSGVSEHMRRVLSSTGTETLEEVTDRGEALLDEVDDDDQSAADVRDAIVAKRAAVIGQHDSRDVLDATLTIARHLDANPRHVKRFDNAYRLQLYVANELSQSDFSPEALSRYARWIVLRLRWPELAERLDGERDLLAALEDHVCAVEPAAEAAAAFGVKLLDQLTSPRGVSELLLDDAHGRISELPVVARLRVS